MKEHRLYPFHFKQIKFLVIALISILGVACNSSKIEEDLLADKIGKFYSMDRLLMHFEDTE